MSTAHETQRSTDATMGSQRRRVISILSFCATRMTLTKARRLRDGQSERPPLPPGEHRCRVAGACRQAPRVWAWAIPWMSFGPCRR